LFEWFDARWQEILLTVGIGAALGTLWRMVMRPETNLQNFLVKAVVSLSVGFVAGGAIVEYMVLDGFKAVGAGSVAAFLAEEVLLFVQVRGQKLKHGKIDTSLRGDDDE
jgi:hypothetical protein